MAWEDEMDVRTAPWGLGVGREEAMGYVDCVQSCSWVCPNAMKAPVAVAWPDLSSFGAPPFAIYGSCLTAGK